MRRVLFFIVFTVGLIYLPFLITRYTLGFHPAKLHPRLAFHAEWEGPPVKEEVRKILNQPFHYFNLGSQCYVFESQDKQFVLKLFRYNRSQFSLIQGVKRLFRRQEHSKSEFHAKIDKTFQACAMAYRDVPECTQLLFVHLNPKNDRLPQVLLTDPSGRTWKLPLDEYRFALQRKAEPFKKTLSLFVESKTPEELDRLLQSYVDLLLERTGKCIRNSDHNMGPNFGFLNNRAIEIDCGNYRKCPELSNPEKRIEEMHRFNVQLYIWLLKHAREHSPRFHRQFTAAYEKVRNLQELSE